MSNHEQQEKKGGKKAPADRKTIANATWRIHIGLYVEGQDEAIAEGDLAYADTFVAQSSNNVAYLLTGRMTELAQKHLHPPKKRGRRK